MKTKTCAGLAPALALRRFAAVAAVLLAFCLVFMIPVGAAEAIVVEVKTTADAQAALDNATKGTTIQLVSGVNYGTLYLRPSANDGVTKVVDWQGNNYNYETYSLFEDVTIIGAPGAIVDAIEIEGGTYYNTPHSQSETYPIMLSLIELKNVVIDGVTFTGNGGKYGDNHGNAISLAGNNIKVDGLTLKNCVLQDPSNNNRLLYKTEGTTQVHTYTYGDDTYTYGDDTFTYGDDTFTFSPTLKNITVTGCTFNGGYMGLELRETENVVITNNIFNSVGDINILLAVNTGCTYSGTITITDNTAENSKERFVRMSGAGSANVVITGNTITNYKGEDADLIKVTDVTTGILTIENNAISGNTAVALQAAINYADDGAVIKLGNDITLTDSLIISKSVTIDGKKSDTENYKISLPEESNNRAAIYLKDNNDKITVTLKNLDVSAPNYYAVKVGSKADLTIDNCNLAGWGALYVSTNTNSCETDNADGSEISITNSKLTGTCVNAEVFGTVTIASNNTKLAISGSTLTSVLKDVAGWQPIILYNTGKSKTAGYTGSSVTITDSELTLTPYPYTFEDQEGYPKRLLLMFDNGFDEFETVSGSFTVNAGVTSNFLIDSAYLAENCVCVLDGESYIVKKLESTPVIPETVSGVESGSDDSGNSIIKAPEGNVVDNTETGGSVEIYSTDEDVVVSFVITGATVNDGAEGKKVITLDENAEIKANYKLQDVSDGSTNVATFQLSLKIDNVSKPLPVIDATVDKDIMEGHDTPVKSVLAMITALGDDRNDNLAKGDGNKITITFSIPVSAIENLNNLAAYHVDKDGKKTKAEMDEPEKSGNEYRIKIHGKSFSSYVLVEEEPQDNLGGGSAVDTGSGNYQYYPRSVPTDGIVDFGTSKVVTGMELPAGSDGTVTLNTKPTFAMPENGFYAFEIDAPGYNLDAKINGGLSFQIPVADLEAEGFTANDIVLFHGTVAEDGKITWEALPTNLVKVENGIAYYKAAINGCSPFYIGFVKNGAIINEPIVEPTVPETPVTPNEPETLPPADTPETPETPASPAPILAILAGLGAVAALRRK